MQILIPFMLLGGAVGLALYQAPVAPKVAQPPTAAEGLGGYLQAVVGSMNDDITTSAQGFLGALSADPDNLLLRQRALESGLSNHDTATALRLAKSLPPEHLGAMAQLLLFTEAVTNNDLKAARQHLRSLQAATPQLPTLTVLESYLAAAEGVAANKLAEALQARTNGWSAKWHASRLLQQSGDTAAARTLLQAAVVQAPSAYLPAAQLWPLLQADAQAELTNQFSAYNPGLAPLLALQPSSTMPAPSQNLGNNTAAALLEFALQVWAENVPLLAQQVLSIAAMIPTDDPLLTNLLPYYRAVVADDLGQIATARMLYASLQPLPNGFGALASLRLNELNGSEATTPRARKAAANKAAALAQQYPTFSVFWHSALQLALLAEEYPEAASIATQLIALTPTVPSNTLPQRQAEGYFARGVAWAQAGNSAKAEADLQQAIVRNPGHAEALNYLGFMWVDENRNLEAAYSMLKRAHLLAPANGAITDSVGWAYYRKGDYTTAQNYLELAAQQEPGTPEILSHLADTYFKLGKQDEARKLWQRALDLANQGAPTPSPAFMQDLERKVRTGKL